MGRIIPYIMENKKCLKPPTSWYTTWWYTFPSEKYEFVSWDDNIPNWMEKMIQMFQTTNQYNIKFELNANIFQLCLTTGG